MKCLISMLVLAMCASFVPDASACPRGQRGGSRFFHRHRERHHEGRFFHRHSYRDTWQDSGRCPECERQAPAAKPMPKGPAKEKKPVETSATERFLRLEDGTLIERLPPPTPVD